MRCCCWLPLIVIVLAGLALVGVGTPALIILAGLFLLAGVARLAIPLLYARLWRFFSGGDDYY